MHSCLVIHLVSVFFFQAEDGIRDLVRSRGLGDVYKRQPHGLSLALVIRQGGEVLLERYGHQPDTVFGPGAPVTADTTLISWSMAKSITHAAVGVLVGEGRLRLEAPAPVPSWQGTEKEAITLQQLLEMRSGPVSYTHLTLPTSDLV